MKGFDMLHATPDNYLGEFQLLNESGPRRLNLHRALIDDLSSNGHTEGAAEASDDLQSEIYGQLAALGRYIAHIAAPIKDMGGDHDYDGAMQVVWKSIHEELGIPRDICSLDTAQVGDDDCAMLADTSYRRATKHGFVRRGIGSSVRLKVYAQDGYRCLSCGTSDDLTVDHIYPVSLGGTNELSNLQTLCLSCNISKGARVPDGKCGEDE